MWNCIYFFLNKTREGTISFAGTEGLVTSVLPTTAGAGAAVEAAVAAGFAVAFDVKEVVVVVGWVWDCLPPAVSAVLLGVAVAVLPMPPVAGADTAAAVVAVRVGVGVGVVEAVLLSPIEARILAFALSSLLAMLSPPPPPPPPAALVLLGGGGGGDSVEVDRVDSCSVCVTLATSLPPTAAALEDLLFAAGFVFSFSWPLTPTAALAAFLVVLAAGMVLLTLAFVLPGLVAVEPAGVGSPGAIEFLLLVEGRGRGEAMEWVGMGAGASSEGATGDGTVLATKPLRCNTPVMLIMPPPPPLPLPLLVVAPLPGPGPGPCRVDNRPVTLVAFFTPFPSEMGSFSFLTAERVVVSASAVGGTGVGVGVGVGAGGVSLTTTGLGLGVPALCTGGGSCPFTCLEAEVALFPLLLLLLLLLLPVALAVEEAAGGAARVLVDTRNTATQGTNAPRN